jgi:hypothetical protein
MPFKHWVGEKQKPPAAAHPGIESNEILRRLRPGMGHEQDRTLLESLWVRDGDRHDLIPTFERFKRLRPTLLKAQPLPEYERERGQ